MAEFQGRWKMVDSQNFEEYMKALNVGAIMRKAGAAVKPTQEISVSGEQMTIKTLSTFKNVEISFTIGQEFDETTADGRKVKTTVTKEGNKLVMEQKGEIDSTITRELSPDGKSFVMKLEAKGVVATRSYQKDE